MVENDHLKVQFTKNRFERLPSFDTREQLTYSWDKINVYVTVKGSREGKQSSIFNLRRKKEMQERHILKDVSGICRPGELLAILGASGAGKTTLLNVLTFRNNDKVRISGDVFLNGERVDPVTLPSRSAYVQQVDMFVGTLTVREQLIFQAMLRMDRYLTKEERMARVDDVITEMGMAKCADTKIGIPGRVKGISGGEMKRLAFACEVLTNPTLLFCDEPTSGLDAFMAQNVVAVMKNMAENGKTILSTIHQPSSEVYAMFDRVLLIAEGRVAFLGDVDAAYEFFARIRLPCPPNYNPADYFISTLAVQPGQEGESRKTINFICDQFDNSSECQKVVKAIKDSGNDQKTTLRFQEEPEVPKSAYKTSWWQQFRILCWRSWIEVVREPMILKIRFVQVALVGLLIGIIYFKQGKDQMGVTNINGALFLILSNLSFQSLFGVINIFCNQIPIFLREHFNGMYRTDVYFLSKGVAELPFFMAIPLIYLSAAYFMIGLDPDPAKFFICLVIVILITNTAMSFGYVISCISKNLNMALVLALPFVIPFMLFGGYYLNLQSAPRYLSWLQYLSWFSYGNEALYINQWAGITNITCGSKVYCFQNGDEILDYYHYKKENLLLDLFGLLLLLLLYRIVAFLALLSKTLRKH